MSFDQTGGNDPLGFMRNLWSGMGFSIPGMVAPTFDVDELDKRIKDMKAVEGWLRMNLSMLQMTIQNLEMQRTTVSAVQTMSKMASDAAQNMQQAASGDAPAADPSAVDASTKAISDAAMWPWQMMQQMREQMEQAAAAQAATTAPEAPAEKAGTRRGKK